jgi:acetylornithine deacetylase
MARRKRDEGPFEPDYAPPYTTIHTGIIRGGTALNIVPKDCSFDFEFRLLPRDNPETALRELRAFAKERVLPEMQAVRPQTGISFEELSSFPGLDTAADAEVTRLVAALSGANGTGKVSFGTEAGLFQAAGIPTVVCGPGSIEEAHKPDEFIALDQIAECERFLRRLFHHVTRHVTR